MALINQPFPVAGTKIAEVDGSVTMPYRYLLQALWDRTGSAPGVSSTDTSGTADEALAAAEAAQTTADAAASTASSAAGTANSAKTAADAAQSSANASLKIASNLSDLASAASARTNLGLGPIATSATVAGWSAATGTLARTAINGSFSQAVSNPPTQAQVQAIADQVAALSKALAALITDQITVKTIGP